jgi:large subunit ribosomal protein L22
MQFVAKARYVRFSPYKLRPLADVVRGKNVQYALNWLATTKVRRSVPMSKLVESAAANAKNVQNVEASQLFIKEIRIDQGPIYRYFKPGAMGRANVQRKRFSHLSIILEPVVTKGV